MLEKANLRQNLFVYYLLFYAYTRVQAPYWRHGPLPLLWRGRPTEMRGERRGLENMAEQQPRRGASNIDTFEGQWQQLRGQVSSWWGKLTDADLDKIAGKKDVLVGLMQERYGYARERAEQEVERRLQEYSDQMEASGVRQMGETVKTAAQDVAARLTETAATTASAVADTVKGAVGYLQAKGMDQIMGDLTGLIRRYPIPALLIGLGIGLLVGRSLGKATMTPADARVPGSPMDAPRGTDASFEEIER
jgi:uncharacterized protein YjbJ (UPF0337 family)